MPLCIGPTSTEETNRRLFKSLLINIFLVTLAWATPPISASLLEAAGPNVPWAIYGPIAGGAIEISTIVMCPVLYVVWYNFPFNKAKNHFRHNFF
jgi:hypothetical protein